MKQYTQKSLIESIRSLRETMDIIEGRATAPQKPMDTSSSLPPPNFQNDPMIQHPFSNATNFALNNQASLNDKLAGAFGNDPAVHGRGAYNPSVAPDPAVHGRGAFTPPVQHGTAAKPVQTPQTFSQQSSRSADRMLNQTSPYSAPKPEMHQFHPSDTSYAQDHPSSFIPPEDNFGGPSDLDKVRPMQSVKGNTGAAAKPAARTTNPAARTNPAFDPAVQQMQKELIAKGYPLKADGILGPKTKAAMDWEKQNNAMEIPSELDNPQGDFDRYPEIENDYDDLDIESDHIMPDRRIAEHVSFSQDDSLARIIQLARG